MTHAYIYIQPYWPSITNQVSITCQQHQRKEIITKKLLWSLGLLWLWLQGSGGWQPTGHPKCTVLTHTYIGTTYLPYLLTYDDEKPPLSHLHKWLPRQGLWWKQKGLQDRLPRQGLWWKQKGLQDQVTKVGLWWKQKGLQDRLPRQGCGGSRRVYRIRLPRQGLWWKQKGLYRLPRSNLGNSVWLRMWCVRNQNCMLLYIQAMWLLNCVVCLRKVLWIQGL